MAFRTLEPVTTILAVFLLVNAAWSFLVWPMFLRRVLKDPRARTASGARTPFLIVHQVLVAVSLALALGLLGFGIAGLLSGSYA